MSLYNGLVVDKLFASNMIDLTKAKTMWNGMAVIEVVVVAVVIAVIVVAVVIAVVVGVIVFVIGAVIVAVLVHADAESSSKYLKEKCSDICCPHLPKYAQSTTAKVKEKAME